MRWLCNFVLVGVVVSVSAVLASPISECSGKTAARELLCLPLLTSARVAPCMEVNTIAGMTRGSSPSGMRIQVR
jgi:hypothetical protein